MIAVSAKDILQKGSLTLMIDDPFAHLKRGSLQMGIPSKMDGAFWFQNTSESVTLRKGHT